MIKFNKREYINIARELCYPSEVIRRLKAAKTENECNRIMHDARDRKE